MRNEVEIADRRAALVVERRRRRSQQVRLALIFLACAILLEALIGDHGLSQTRRARHDLDRLAQSVDALKGANADLRVEVRRLQQDPDALEVVARQQLGLIRPGEILVVLKDVQ